MLMFCYFDTRKLFCARTDRSKTIWYSKRCSSNPATNQTKPNSK